MEPYLTPIARIHDYIPPAGQLYPITKAPSRSEKGERTRAKILAILADGPKTAEAIAQAMKMHVCPMRRHLNTLALSGRVERGAGRGVWQLTEGLE